MTTNSVVMISLSILALLFGVAVLAFTTVVIRRAVHSVGIESRRGTRPFLRFGRHTGVPIRSRGAFVAFGIPAGKKEAGAA
jgi:hypothetical protein